MSTPQEVALADARKGIAMFTGEAVNVPILGLVENMAWFTPAQHPDERYYIFGEGGAVRLAEEQGVRLLAQIPLVMDIRSHADNGAPVALQLTGDPSMASPEAQAFGTLADNVVSAVEERNSTLPPTTKVNVSH